MQTDGNNHTNVKTGHINQQRPADLVGVWIEEVFQFFYTLKLFLN